MGLIDWVWHGGEFGFGPTGGGRPNRGVTLVLGLALPALAEHCWYPHPLAPLSQAT